MIENEMQIKNTMYFSFASNSVDVDGACFNPELEIAIDTVTKPLTLLALQRKYMLVRKFVSTSFDERCRLPFSLSFRYACHNGTGRTFHSIKLPFNVEISVRVCKFPEISEAPNNPWSFVAWKCPTLQENSLALLTRYDRTYFFPCNSCLTVRYEPKKSYRHNFRASFGATFSSNQRLNWLCRHFWACAFGARNCPSDPIWQLVKFNPISIRRANRERGPFIRERFGEYACSQTRHEFVPTPVVRLIWAFSDLKPFEDVELRSPNVFY